MGRYWVSSNCYFGVPEAPSTLHCPPLPRARDLKVYSRFILLLGGNPCSILSTVPFFVFIPSLCLLVLHHTLVIDWYCFVFFTVYCLLFVIQLYSLALFFIYTFYSSFLLLSFICYFHFLYSSFLLVTLYLNSWFFFSFFSCNFISYSYFYSFIFYPHFSFTFST